MSVTQFTRDGDWKPWTSLFTNASFLILNTLLGSLFGFAFWMIATRIYNPVEIGIGAAYISSITLLSTLGDMGLGITLIRFAPTSGQQKKGFINTSAIAVAACTFVFATVFVFGAPLWSPEFKFLANTSWLVLGFVGTALSFSLAQFTDRLFIAFENSQYLVFRNLLFNVIRIAFLVLFAHSFRVFGLLLSIGVAALITLFVSILVFVPRVITGYRVSKEFAWLSVFGKARYTIGNHISQLLWNLPQLLYPLLIINFLGARSNALFYTSWMIANLLFILPTALSTSAFANISNSQGAGRSRIWKIMRWTLVCEIPVVLGMVAFSGFLLGMFGNEYARGGTLLNLLLLSIFPYTVISYMIVDYRICQDTRGLVCLVGFTAIVSIILVVGLGCEFSITGIGIGWIVGQTLGMIFGFFSNFKKVLL